MRRVLSAAVFLTLVPLLNRPAAAQSSIVYTVAFPAPQHHYAEIALVLDKLPPGPLQLRMSRSSPGRYALHEFAKNVFDVRVFEPGGKALAVSHPNPHQWDVPSHPAGVRVTYKVFGNLVDGTYLGIDASHAHMNMPATLMWARGLDGRPIRVTFVPPAGLNWKPATQLFPTDDGWTFTAPNLQY